ncbi:CRISPR-associated ring nuclease [Maridesulfovibrio zosterae]|uniref:CRISPR-associated ring nuclease n=1 Tax=Maridesulfovibrio zosterae TaxID=82171 RepID=UPI00040B2126|nr:CRISPR-associated ring nuclease [Maridesulfovibrio zosterae]
MGVNDGGKKNGVALLVLSGVNPQLVTEALYALHRECADPESEYYDLEYPEKVHVITTKEGQNSLYSGLGYDVRTMSKQNEKKIRRERGENPGSKFKSFCENYGREDVVFTPQNVHVISDGGKPLVDITNAKDSRIAEVFIMHEVMELAKHNTIYAVIGGRASMSVFLYTTFQILGEGGHRVFHIPAGKELMERKKLFYPALDKNTGQPKKEEDELIDLCELPVFALSDVDKVAGYKKVASRIVESQFMFDGLEAVIELKAGKDSVCGVLRADKYELELQGAKLFFFLLLLFSKEKGIVPARLSKKANMEDIAYEILGDNSKFPYYAFRDDMGDIPKYVSDTAKELATSAFSVFGTESVPVTDSTKKGKRPSRFYIPNRRSVVFKNLLSGYSPEPIRFD